jgi:hypothetical protein
MAKPDLLIAKEEDINGIVTVSAMQNVLMLSHLSTHFH